MNFRKHKLTNFINVSHIVNVHYFEFINKYSTKNDSHNFCELLYVDRGLLYVQSENYTGELAVNQLIIHRPNEIHSLKTSDTIAPNVIIIGFECDSDSIIPLSKNPITITLEQEQILSNIMQEAMHFFEPPYDVPNTYFMKKQATSPFGTDQMIKINLESLLISLVRDFEHITKAYILPKTNSIHAVHKYLIENYKSKITLNNLCFLFRTNKTTLCKNFKDEYNTTILNYINGLRVKEAKILLKEGKMTVTEIADSLGFESIHYFCRMFKKVTGKSPSKYMQ